MAFPSLAPNATHQARGIVGAKHERTLSPVACTCLFGLGLRAALACAGARVGARLSGDSGGVPSLVGAPWMAHRAPSSSAPRNRRPVKTYGKYPTPQP